MATFSTTGKEPYEHEYAIKLQCIALGSTLPASLPAIVHANAVAGTKGWPLVGALNRIAGNATKNYRDLEGVLNQLAGTKSLGENAASSKWAGR